jgi:hypothetical protein
MSAHRALARDCYSLEVKETFDGDVLDERRWVPCYLPQCSTQERSAVAGGCLRLLIEADQEPRCPELDGQVRVYVAIPRNSSSTYVRGYRQILR